MSLLNRCYLIFYKIIVFLKNIVNLWKKVNWCNFNFFLKKRLKVFVIYLLLVEVHYIYYWVLPIFNLIFIYRTEQSILCSMQEVPIYNVVQKYKNLHDEFMRELMIVLENSTVPLLSGMKSTCTFQRFEFCIVLSQSLLHYHNLYKIPFPGTF